LNVEAGSWEASECGFRGYMKENNKLTLNPFVMNFSINGILTTPFSFTFEDENKITWVG
jgi:hypothetical protein